VPAPYTGGCFCGAVRYVIEREPLTFYICHCTDCQRRTGGAFGQSLVIERGAIRLVAGTTVHARIDMPDGRIKQGQICAACGARMWGEPAKAPQIAIVQAGTLDDRSWLRPVAHIWTRSAQPWLALPKDAVLYEQQPPFADLLRLGKERAAAP
jgi:hypothetical protein